MAGRLPDTVVGTQGGVGIPADTTFRDTDTGKKSSSWGVCVWGGGLVR